MIKQNNISYLNTEKELSSNEKQIEFEKKVREQTRRKRSINLRRSDFRRQATNEIG